MNKYRIYNLITILFVVLGLSFFAAFTIHYDPMFHYYGPREGISYELDINDERYVATGIARHFDYDSMICGSSVNENFKTTQFDKLFDAKSIKVPISGGYMREVAEIIDAGFETHKNMKYVLRSLDTYFISSEDEVNPDAVDVSYLVNNNPLDDVYYLFNFDVFIGKTLRNRSLSKNNIAPTTFDDYANWSKDTEFGAFEYNVDELNEIPEQINLFDYEIEHIRKNVEENILKTIRKHRDTQFLLYYVPYSAVYYLSSRQTYSLKRFCDCERIVFEMLVNEPNVKLYGFSTDFDMCCNLKNYRDPAHYGEWINELILSRISQNRNLLTNENAEEYFNKIYDFYIKYKIK